MAYQSSLDMWLARHRHDTPLSFSGTVTNFAA
jgi:hypothetical protein